MPAITEKECEVCGKDSVLYEDGDLCERCWDELDGSWSRFAKDLGIVIGLYVALALAAGLIGLIR